MLTDLQFAYLAPDELRPDPRNPRTHSKKQIEQIAASMTELGFAGAIVINPDRMIIAGHARYRAANLCVWRKSNAGMGSLYRSQHELVGVFRVGTAQHFNAVELGRHGRTRTNVWEAASVRARELTVS